MKYIIFFLLLISNQSFAEIYNCNGTWVNRPCKGDILAEIAEVNRSPKTKDKIDLEQKNLIIHDLQTLKFKGERETGLTFMISEVVATCQDSEQSLQDCSNQAHDKVDEISKSILAIKVNKEKTAPTPSEQDISITVVENQESLLDNMIWYRPKRPTNNHRPISNDSHVQPPLDTKPPLEPLRKSNHGKVIGLK